MVERIRETLKEQNIDYDSAYLVQEAERRIKPDKEDMYEASIKLLFKLLHLKVSGNVTHVLKEEDLRREIVPAAAPALKAIFDHKVSKYFAEHTKNPESIFHIP